MVFLGYLMRGSTNEIDKAGPLTRWAVSQSPSPPLHKALTHSRRLSLVDQSMAQADP